ncbi:E3 ubiquitin-protein ligase CCNB1IP1 [Colletotrichum plurivorum]|uniref:E3 ubiquitin-protein ligase CCNB1IP1 n=1 Tax=Colletotrichum plurivorum TaxID=2175906 RepID=A0A8H6MX25_9PEZI|nr:E3 ubiquitin-protein ligase CCNB1IP1 [Colletotrichum plurivorum]
MEQSVRCNIRACRRNVGEQALVTTCSHIFCVECAEKHGLSGPGSEARKICPACNGHLQSPDDAVVANLNLSEGYKTSVLSGLSPSVIMECTGRALSFWAYQANQEEIFQHYVIKTLTEKIRILNQQFQKTIDDANTEIESLRDKLRAQNADYDNLRRKYEELGLSYKDKCRRFAQLQELHNKVKRKAELVQMEAAASDTVDSSFQQAWLLPARRPVFRTKRYARALRAPGEPAPCWSQKVLCV